jgi:hypothetical protein
VMRPKRDDVLAVAETEFRRTDHFSGAPPASDGDGCDDADADGPEMAVRAYHRS